MNTKNSKSNDITKRIDEYLADPESRFWREDLFGRNKKINLAGVRLSNDMLKIVNQMSYDYNVSLSTCLRTLIYIGMTEQLQNVREWLFNSDKNDNRTIDDVLNGVPFKKPELKKVDITKTGGEVKHGDNTKKEKK